MFQNAADVARAALELTELARKCAEQGDLENSARVEMSAAVLAVHVADWHARPDRLHDALRERFKAFSPDWETLREIVNGVKHPSELKPPRKRPGPHEQRDPYWEDPEFWEAGGMGATLCVQIEGRWRSVRALTISFCADYLAKGDLL